LGVVREGKCRNDILDAPAIVRYLIPYCRSNDDDDDGWDEFPVSGSFRPSPWPCFWHGACFGFLFCCNFVLKELHLLYGG
jgi:hypothetical protein